MEVDTQHFSPSGMRGRTDADQEMAEDNYFIQDNNANGYVETPTNPRGFFADTKTATACSVRVALRVRPLVGRELYESPNICVQCYPDQDQIVIGKDRAFTFDRVFDIPTRQQDVFDLCVKNLVLGCFSGYNATVLAYGQTGSGKTFTMGSGYTIGLKDEELGIIPRVIRLIFEEVDKRKHKAEFIIKCTFLEIYNEELNDLLDHGSLTSNSNANQVVLDRFMQKKEITIREEKNGNISVFGLREEKVNSYEELAACLDKGSNFRSTASTLMNNCSSRSHAIFTISIEQHVIDDLYQPNAQPNAGAASGGAESDEFMVAKFHFVDLAGSERAKRTGATGATLKEGISINKGLLALGNVISALTEEGKKNSHVPYRDSKLTRILQDSLGGNSRTSMIACVSPAEINFEETLNTLKYASRARNIKNKPIVNRDPNSQQIAQLRQQVYELQRELVSARKLLISNNIEFDQSNSLMPADLAMLESAGGGQYNHQNEGGYAVSAAEIQRFESEIKDLKQFMGQKDKKISQLQLQNDHFQEQISQNQIEFFSIQKERDVTRFQLEQLVDILKKRKIYEEIMVELHGGSFDPNEQLAFGSSGPCILEEYQVKVEEQKKELSEKQQQVKTLQKDNEMLIQQAQQDIKNLEAKEKEIERLKRSLNKTQKENATIKNDQRRGTTTRIPPNIQQQQNLAAESKQPYRKMSTVANTDRKPIVPKRQDPSKGGATGAKGEWISSELDYNIKHFNQLFIENLSQSLSSMLVIKKPNQEEQKTPLHKQHSEFVPNHTDIQDFNMDPVHEGDSNSDEEEHEQQNQNQGDPDQEMEQLLPEKDLQEVIDQNEESRKEDEEIKSMLQQHELQIVTLEGDLKNKEALLSAIKESHKMMSGNLLEAMKNEYHKKIQLFQTEMQLLEQERVESLKKADTVQQKSKLEEVYKKKLKELEDKLKEAKQKDREQTNMMKESNKQKLRIKSLETEIEKMKTQKVTMIKKMKEESDNHRKWKAERVKELMQVKQQNQKKDREIQLLKRENLRKDLLAKRKQEELSLLMKKSKIEKQKQVNAANDRMKKANIDIHQIQQWIISNTEKMLKYKDLQSLIDQDLTQKHQVEEQIAEEQNQYAQLSVHKEKLEFRKCQIEQNSEENPDSDAHIYELDEEITQISYEMKAIQENIETLEEKFDFVDNKIAQIQSELNHFSPNDVEQLRFDQVQSIEGARACLGAFFGILLDVNVYKKQLENQVAQNEATIESLGQQLEELRKIQLANEVNFQKELEQISAEYKQKEEMMMRIIMENGGTELEQQMLMLEGKKGTEWMGQLLKQEEQVQAIQSQMQQPQLKRNATTVNERKLEIQKNNKEQYNQSKTALSRRVAELERRNKEDQKRIESMRHKFEQSHQEKEVIKKQLDTVKQKLKNQEVQEVKVSKLISPDDLVQLQFNSNQPQKSPRQNQQQKMQTLQEMRKERKIKKLGSQPVGVQKPIIEPRVIADEPMEDNEDEDMPFAKDLKTTKGQSTFENNGQVLQTLKPNDEGNVFTRLSQTQIKPKPTGGANSLNTSQSFIAPGTSGQGEQPHQKTFDDDGKWKCIFNKEIAHNGNICALTSVGNQLYSTSNKSLKIWDLEKMQVVSDITAHSGFIKCMSIWQDKNILLTASDKVIFLWDMISLTQVGQLKAHKDEIKAMAVSPDGNLMFSAGKGSQNAPGLLLWDLRRGSQPLDEREKNQDIFSLTTTSSFLFYGCRSHQVIPFNFKTFEQFQAFEPPHFDAVTSLSILDGYLVSGSRDKMVRCWDYQRFSHMQVEVAHNDWVNTLETDHDQKELYSGSKDGFIKIWRMKNSKLKCSAQLQASVTGQSINTLSKIDKQFGKMIASGSADKSLKIWKRKGGELEDSPDQQEFEDPFEVNQDFEEGEEDLMKVSSQVNKYEEIKYEGKHNQIGRSNTTLAAAAGTSQHNYYVPAAHMSKMEQKRRQKRLQDNQRRYQKENDQNFQQI